MRLCSRHSLVLATLVLIVFAVIGCSQKDDVVKPLTRADLTLRPANLPELESLYCYEFWALSVEGTDSTFASLGKFLWDNTMYRFRDLDGNAIDSVFELPEAYYTYDYLIVTIENRIDASPLTPSGTILMRAAIADPFLNQIKLAFPQNISMAQGTFFVATPTDDTMNLANESKGVWLCSRIRTPRFNHDTLGVDSSYNRVSPVDSTDPNPFDPDIIGVKYPTDSIWTIIDTFVVFGYDTIPHRRINIEWDTLTDPDNDYTLFVYYNIDSISSDNTHPLGQLFYNAYQNTALDYPDIRPFGWRYNAWVFLENFSPLNNLPESVPFGFKSTYPAVAEAGWRVVSLGPFFRPDSADLSNQYGDNLEVPNFPGEDFIRTSPPMPAGYDNLNFSSPVAPDTTYGTWGTVVVGMEPLPTNMTTDASRNFPLFFLHADLNGNTELLHNFSDYMPTIDVEVTFKE